ncbi:Bacterial low temperature requirement A protein (LtrA) [compost metagenome]
MSASTGLDFYQHGLRRMRGRDPQEQNRTATTLELFFDLTFVTAFGVAGSELAHGIEVGHYAPAIVSFAIACLSIIWAWANYAWLASAFDNDDWLFRSLTLVQMAGVIVLAVGIPMMFASIDQGAVLDANVMVAGYIVMRVALIGQWLRVARHDPQHRMAARGNAIGVGIAQLGWTSFLFLPLSLVPALCCLAVFWIIDFSAPLIAERVARSHGESGIPWHAHHLAERYSLMSIIALGECIVGTLAAARTISQGANWNFESIVVVAAGVLISFSLWWAYFQLPSGPVLHLRRDKAAAWIFGHIALFTSIAAIGAGLHTIGYAYDPEAATDPVVVIVALAIPVFAFMVIITLLLTWLLGAPMFTWAHLPTFLMPLAAAGLSQLGVPVWACLLVLLCSPLTVIIVYELGYWRKLAVSLDRVLVRPAG